MTTPAISLNPALQTSFPGTFFVSSSGLEQGDAQDDPAIRFRLRKGINSPAATVPLWAGLAICSAPLPGGVGVGATNPSSNLGNVLTPAANLTAGTAGFLNGWTVTNQSTALIVTAQSRVGQAPSGGAINYYPSGSGARIPLPALSAAAIEWASSATVGPQDIYWDTVNLRLTNAAGGGIIGPLLNVSIDSISLTNSKVVNYNQNSSGYATTGQLNWLEGQPAVVLVV